MKDVLDPADGYIELNRQAEKKGSLRCLRTIINHFFESSTRTRTSFEIAGKPGKEAEAANG
jgi:aspartate carbamoyltransferase catalytic subunit